MPAMPAMPDPQLSHGRLLRQPVRTVWPLWFMTYLGGYAFAVLVGIVINPLFELLAGYASYGQDQSWLVTPAMLVWAILLGASIGVLQWLVLRLYFPGLKWQRWVVPTGVGLVISLLWVFLCGGSLLLVLILRELYNTNRYTPLIFTLIACVVLAGVGAILGAIQQRVLSQYVVHTRRWVWVSTLASAAGGLLFGLVFMVTREGSGYFSFGPWYALSLGAVFFATLGLITGIMLYKMLKEHFASTP
jgi:hypothetical protein